MGDLKTAAERALAALLAWEQWEADIILDDRCWAGNCPVIGQPHLDALTPVQYDRKRAVAGLRKALEKEG